MARIYDRDPYAILGIYPTATASQVKEAYHRLARQYHPDLNKDPRAGERMKDINWAYDILSDPQERSLYDYWRNYGAQAEYYYPGTSPSDSRDDQDAKPPPYSPYGRRSYTNVRVTRSSSSIGCSAWGIVWIIVILITNLARALGPALSQQANYNYSPELRANQTAEMEIELTKLDSAIETLHASDGRPTPGVVATLVSSFHVPPVTPSPKQSTIVPKENADQAETKSEYAPGSFVWKQLHTYFPELTTPDGLSDEVTSITYDQLKGYHIKTRSLGEYWLYIDRNNHVISPMHFPPAADPISTP
jgi:hypothetical protein